MKSLIDPLEEQHKARKAGILTLVFVILILSYFLVGIFIR